MRKARGVVVAVAGPSASGKSTVVDAAARRYGWVPLDEAYYRLPRRPRLTWSSERELRRLELRLLAEEARRFVEARSWAARGRTVVVDTPFLDPVAYTAGLFRIGLARRGTLDAVLSRARALAEHGRLGVPDLTVALSVPAATRRERAARDPLRHPARLRARHEAVGRAEAVVAVPCLRRAAPGRVRALRAVGSAGSVAARLRAAVAGTSPLGDPCSVALRALEALRRRTGPRRPPPARGNLKKGTLPPRRPR